MALFGFLRKKGVDPKVALETTLRETELPSFPAVVMEALAALRNPDLSMRAIGEIVASDPGLSVRLLRTVNSAAFALRSRVHSVQQAVVLLGRSNVESIVLSVAVRDALPSSGSWSSVQFWRTAARRAAAARSFAEVLHPGTQGESFSAALLQDMAIPLLIDGHPGYADLFEDWSTNRSGQPLVDRERERFGFDHAEVGTWIADRWDFPETLAASIGAHHGDRSIEPAPPPAVELVADLHTPDGDEDNEAIIDRCRSLYDLGEDHARRILDESIEAGSGLAKFIK